MRARTPEKTVGKRALNRATLARQMLLRREAVGVVPALERLVALQAQLARPPFVALWSRLAGFEREALVRAIERRDVVRGTMMRTTIHLVSRKDYLAMRPVLQASLSRAAAAVLKERAGGLDVEALVASARRCFETKPCTFAQLRTQLARAFPKLDERAMGYMVRLHLPLVQTPAEGAAWAYPGAADFAVAESWLGARLGKEVRPHALVRRYLAAFGPASIQDLQGWTGLNAAAGVVDELRPKLRVYRDDRGRELFDVPDGELPPEDAEAPVRFLPEFDNVLLGYAVRTRVLSDAHKRAIFTKNLLVPATFLVDGFVAGVWGIERKKGVARLEVRAFGALAKQARSALAEEGDALLRFVEPDAATRSVEFSTAKVPA